jgi:hypothetical protein
MLDPLFETELGDVRITITEAGAQGMKLDFDLLDLSRRARQELSDNASLEFTPIKGTVTLTAGNLATEDLVYLLHGEGVETGIDLDALIECAQWLSEQLGKELPGQVYKAGTFEPVAG